MSQQFELYGIVVNFGKASKIVKYAKEHGITGATIFLGRGTTQNHILKLLDLTDIRKEIVLMVAEKEIGNQALESLNKKFKFNKPNQGIAFSLSIRNLFGIRNSHDKKLKEKRGVHTKMYQSIFVVVDKGKAEQVLDAAVAAGSKGGTVINARGSGIHEQKMLFSIPIEPEKEIVMILAEQSTTDTIVNAIRGDLKIDEPGMGILFVLDVNQAYGLY
jgi:nitrogen regulatory protein PII